MRNYFKRTFCLVAVIFSLLFLLIGNSTVNAKSLPDLNAGTLEEYEQLLKEKVPKEYKADFVTYDMVKSIGSFETFAFTLAWISGDYSDYGYKLCDETGCEYIFTIYTKPTDRFSKIDEWYSGLSGEDLRTCNTSEHVNLSVGEVHYLYRSGKLEMIFWEGELHLFELYVIDDVTEYDLGNDTFLSTLLNANTAEQAAAKLNKTIDRKLAWNRFVAKAGIPILIVIIILVAAGVFLIVRKMVLSKKRTRMLLDPENS